MQTTTLAQGSNFLLPNWTFFAELLAFAIVLFVLWRYVVPPVQKAMADRQAMIEKQIQESREATEKLHAAEAKYEEALAEARTEAAKIRDTARGEGQRIVDEMRTKAQEESERIIVQGRSQLASQRAQIVAELRGDLGRMSVELASRVVGESLVDETRRRGTVDRFLDELDSTSAPAGKSAAATSKSK